MKKICIAALLAISLPCFGDTLDQAEAKRRGVAVEVIELEHAKSVNATLESKIADLNQQIAKLKKQLADAQASEKAAKARLANLTPEEQKQLDTANASDAEIQQAIKERRVVNGMTVDQMKRAFSNQNDHVALTSDDGETQTYSIRSFLITIGDDKTLTLDRDIHDVYGVIRVEKGHVVSWMR